MKLKFFDGPLEGVEFEIGSYWPVSKLLIENDNRELLRYECDQIDEVLDTRTGHEAICRMVLSRLPVEFDDELRTSLMEDQSPPTGGKDGE